MERVRLILARPWMGHWTGDSVDVSRVEADLLIKSGTGYEGPGTRAAGADARTEADGVPPKGEPAVDPGEGTGLGVSAQTEAEEKAVHNAPENKARTKRETKYDSKSDSK